MSMKTPIFKIEEEPKKQQKLLNMDFFTSDRAVINTDSNYVEDSPKRGRPKKKTLSNGESMVVVDAEPLPIHKSNEPYLDTYRETSGMLRTSIIQIDMLNNDIQSELSNIKNSKTLKKKYEYISELSGTASNLLNTKISAIREMNKTITDCHNLEMKRIKELKIDVDQNDDKRIMDMYNAFISTPMGNYNPLGPSMSDITLMNGPNNMIRADISPTGDIGYDNYLQNMTPEQNRMRMERNPNIQTVVVYNQETGDRSFEVIDTSTGMVVPNMPKPPDFLLDDMNINIRTATARNSNTDMDFGLIVVGQNASLFEY